MAAQIEALVSPIPLMQHHQPTALAPDTPPKKTGTEEQPLLQKAAPEEPAELEMPLMATEDECEIDGGGDEEDQKKSPLGDDAGAGSAEKRSTPTQGAQAAAAPAPLQKRNHSRGDGYKWRQYGYKRLSCGVVKRLYFFCTARSQTGCTARKLVDRYIVTTTTPLGNPDGEDEGGSACTDGEKDGAQVATRVEDIVEYKGAHNHPPLPNPNSWLDPSQHPHAQHHQAQQQQMSGSSSETGEPPFLHTGAPCSHALPLDGTGSSLVGRAVAPGHQVQFQSPLHLQHLLLQQSGSQVQHGHWAQHPQHQHHNMRHQPSGWYGDPAAAPQQNENNIGSGPSYNVLHPNRHQKPQPQMLIQTSAAFTAAGSNHIGQPGFQDPEHPSGPVFSHSQSMPSSMNTWKHQHNGPHLMALQRSTTMGPAYGASVQSSAPNSMTFMSPTSHVMPGSGPSTPPGKDGPSTDTPFGTTQSQRLQQQQHLGASNGNPMLYQQQSHSPGVPMPMDQKGPFTGSHSFQQSHQPVQQQTMGPGKPSGPTSGAPHGYGPGAQASPAMSHTTKMGPTQAPAQQDTWNMQLQPHQHCQQPQAMRLEASPLALPPRPPSTPSQMAFDALPPSGTSPGPRFFHHGPADSSQVLPRSVSAMPGKPMGGRTRLGGPHIQFTQHQMLQAPHVAAPQARGPMVTGNEMLQDASMAGRMPAPQGLQHQMPTQQQPGQQQKRSLVFVQQPQQHHPPSAWSAGSGLGHTVSLGQSHSHATCHQGQDGAAQCSCHVTIVSSAPPESHASMRPPRLAHLHPAPSQQHLSANAPCQPSTSEQSESNPINMKGSAKDFAGCGPQQHLSAPSWRNTFTVTPLGRPAAAGSGPAPLAWSPEKLGAKAVPGPAGEIIRWQHAEVRARYDILGDSPSSATSPSSSLPPDGPTAQALQMPAWKVEADASHRQDKARSAACEGAERDGLQTSKRHRPNEPLPCSALSRSSGSPSQSLLLTPHDGEPSPTFPHHALASAPPTALFPKTGGAPSPQGILSAPDSLLTSWLTEHSEGSMQSHSSTGGKATEPVAEDTFFSGLIDYLANA